VPAALHQAGERLRDGGRDDDPRPGGFRFKPNTAKTGYEVATMFPQPSDRKREL